MAESYSPWRCARRKGPVARPRRRRAFLSDGHGYNAPVAPQGKTETVPQRLRDCFITWSAAGLRTRRATPGRGL
jgi:hypothetical protein